MALANHGGGFVVLGFKEESGGFIEAPNPPATLTGWSQDRVQGVVARYLEPALQCSVAHIASSGSGQLHPVIIVPSADRVPVMAKKGSPDNSSMVANRVYIRRAGPNSEEPRSPEEWNSLFDRIVQNRRTDLIEAFRSILSGVLPTANTPEQAKTKGMELNDFVIDGGEKWRKLVGELPADSAARMPHGYYDMAFAIDGDFEAVSLSKVAQIVASSVRNHSGWPPFLTIGRSPFIPYALDGAVQCWIKPESRMTEDDPSHNDFWRVSGDGLLFTRRGFLEDGSRSGAERGKTFDLTVPIWRLGEGILNASYIAVAMGGSECDLVCRAEWRGLAGRTLTAQSGRYLSMAYQAHQDRYAVEQVVAVGAVSDLLPELVFNMLKPLYELFDFFQLSKTLVEKELSELTRSRF